MTMEKKSFLYSSLPMAVARMIGSSFDGTDIKPFLSYLYSV
jgi:hypothetical protein